jgi:hypothetical protein
MPAFTPELTSGDKPKISGLLPLTPDDESHFALTEVRVTPVTCRGLIQHPTMLEV